MELELLASGYASSAAVDSASCGIVLQVALPSFHPNDHLPFGQLQSLATLRVRAAFRCLAAGFEPYPLADGAAPDLSSTRFDHGKPYHTLAESTKQRGLT